MSPPGPAESLQLERSPAAQSAAADKWQRRALPSGIERILAKLLCIYRCVGESSDLEDRPNSVRGSRYVFQSLAVGIPEMSPGALKRQSHKE